EVDAHIPNAPPVFHHGRPGTSFRYAFEDECTKWVITASNDSTRGLRFETERTDDKPCDGARAPIHQDRALTYEEWQHIISLVNIAQIETLLPELLHIEIGRGEYELSFTMRTPEGNTRLSQPAGLIFNDMNVQFLV